LKRDEETLPSFVVLDVKGFVFNQTLQYFDSTRTDRMTSPHL